MATKTTQELRLLRKHMPRLSNLIGKRPRTTGQDVRDGAMLEVKKKVTEEGGMDFETMKEGGCERIEIVEQEILKELGR